MVERIEALAAKFGVTVEAFCRHGRRLGLFA